VHGKAQQITHCLPKWQGNYLVPVIDDHRKVIGIVSYEGAGDVHQFNILEGGKKVSSITGVKNVLVVGGAGYLGSVLVRRLLQEGYYVRVLDNLMFGGESLCTFKGYDRFELIEGDVRNISSVMAALENIDAVVHLAAIVGDPACRSLPSNTVETNYLATKMLAEACKYHQVNRFIYASTCSVYGLGNEVLTEESPTCPVSLYARTKIRSEEGILSMKDSSFSPCAMRMSTLHGLSPRMRFDLVVNTFSMHAVVHKEITIHGGEQWRPLLHVEDAADAYVKCLRAPLSLIKGQIFNVGCSKQNYQIAELGQVISEVVPGTRIVKRAMNGDIRDYRVSFNKIQDLLGFKANHGVNESVKEIVAALNRGEISDVHGAKYYNYYEE